ncbi:MAG: alpha-amylase [Micrococcales bacterium 73-15]|uniref:glycoside hydrolase family 13 protein n=1 Tax=Salana multivorans TaxID=120377 RepID=UPI00095D13F2|nr:glycoside hydrolase family 13 protein [Salana multivorans]OJX97044.1 MAG: alpha-amylase [Micrococcales bacterium 73-15]
MSSAPQHPVDDAGRPWWHDAVIYQVYPRSFADANGDGMGDLAGVTAHLDHLAALGVDAIWLSPFYTSPQSDCGYDVADYLDVDPMFGTLADLDDLVAQAHGRGLRVVVDIVPNHSSSAHRLFQAALTAGPGSPERAMYVFRDGRGERGELPPNAWPGGDDGSAWTRVREADGAWGQWYLHIFGIDQPDWDWTNPAVADMFDDVLRFWLDRGVDGFRIDVAHGMAKEDGLPDRAIEPWEGWVIPTVDPATRPPMWDQDAVHDIHRRWRRVVDEHTAAQRARRTADDPAYDDRILVAEAWLEPERLQLYLRPDELHQAFNPDLLVTPWRADDLVAAITTSLETCAAVGAMPTWVLSNHDIVRHATRLGYAADRPLGGGIGPRDEQPDRELGQRRGRAASLLMMALPGGVYLYEGEELGLPEVTDLPDEARLDYVFLESGGAQVGRDGCRVPIPWRADAPAFGFSPTGRSWLPQPEWFREFAADVQELDPDSTLWLYRRALRLRRDLDLGGPASSVEARDGLVVVTRPASCVVANTTGESVEVAVPAGLAPVLVSLGDAGGVPRVGEDRWAVPGDVTVWFG